jgi:hypothetical protein
MLDRLCIQQNHALSHAKLMQDYFVEVPTYPPFLFRRRHRIYRDLFAKLVKVCEENAGTLLARETLPDI